MVSDKINKNKKNFIYDVIDTLNKSDIIGQLFSQYISKINNFCIFYVVHQLILTVILFFIAYMLYNLTKKIK